MPALRGNNMTNCRATYDDGLTEIVFTATMVADDYGVPNSPTFTSIEDVEIDSLTLAGTEIDVKTLPISIVNAFLTLADECEFVGDDE
jgi:hypothetical protein